MSKRYTSIGYPGLRILINKIGVDYFTIVVSKIEYTAKNDIFSIKKYNIKLIKEIYDTYQICSSRYSDCYISRYKVNSIDLHYRCVLRNNG